MWVHLDFCFYNDSLFGSQLTGVELWTLFNIQHRLQFIMIRTQQWNILNPFNDTGNRHLKKCLSAVLYKVNVVCIQQHHRTVFPEQRMHANSRDYFHIYIFVHWELIGSLWFALVVFSNERTVSPSRQYTSLQRRHVAVRGRLSYFY